MKDYEFGIDRPKSCNCDPTKLDHAVLIVGYGVQSNVIEPIFCYYLVIYFCYNYMTDNRNKY